jgi:hypothetical protein
MASLNRADIPTIGAFSEYVEHHGSPPQGDLERLAAVLDAEGADEAKARVRDKLPDGDYTVGHAEPA